MNDPDRLQVLKSKLARTRRQLKLFLAFPLLLCGLGAADSLVSLVCKEVMVKDMVGKTVAAIDSAGNARLEGSLDVKGPILVDSKPLPRIGVATHLLLVSGSEAEERLLRTNLPADFFESIQCFTLKQSDGWISIDLTDPKTGERRHFGRKILGVSYHVEAFNHRWALFSSFFKLVGDGNIVGVGTTPGPGGGLLRIQVIYEE